MKKLIPLLVIAAGAVAYGVYKSKKEVVKEEEKTLVVIDDTPSDDGHPEEPENPLKEVEEAAQEVQEELGVFETLSDSEEPYERPSFFHLTDDSYLEPEDTVKEEPAVVVDEDSEVISEEVHPQEETAFVVLQSEEPAEVTVSETQEENTDDCAVEKPVENVCDIASLETEEVIEEVDDPVVEEFVEESNEDESEPLFEDVHDEPVVPFFDLKDEGLVEEDEEPFVIEDAINQIVQKVEEKTEELPTEAPAIEIRDVLNTEDEELEPLASYDTPELDELMKTIAGQVKAADESEPEEEPVIEQEPEEVIEESVEEETDYLQDIRKITEMYSEKVAQYNIRYPYLSSRFIDDTLKFSQQFNSEYPQGTRVAIEHHAHFDAVEDLFVFAQIIRQTGYSVREGSEDRTLVVTKEMFVDTNSILHDVFKVANQVYCLSGEYQKFRITKR